MNYIFSTPELGHCLAKLWSRGGYGFCFPRRVEICAPNGHKGVYIYRNVDESVGVKMKGSLLVRTAIAQFLATPDSRETIELTSNMPMYDGPLFTLSRWRRVQLGLRAP